MLGLVSPNDLSNETNSFGTAQAIEIGHALARAHRATYVGELGWEMCASTEMASHVIESLIEAGEDVGLKPCGKHAMNMCRIEKGYHHFGHDITCEDHVVDAGLGFAVSRGKPDSVGRQAVLKRKESGPRSRLLQFKLNDPEPLLYHHEPILRDGECIGFLTSGDYGHTVGAAIGLGYVPCKDERVADVLASKYEIDICRVKVAADVSLKPLYDPKSERVKV